MKRNIILLFIIVLSFTSSLLQASTYHFFQSDSSQEVETSSLNKKDLILKIIREQKKNCSDQATMHNALAGTYDPKKERDQFHHEKFMAAVHCVEIDDHNRHINMIEQLDPAMLQDLNPEKFKSLEYTKIFWADITTNHRARLHKKFIPTVPAAPVTCSSSTTNLPANNPSDAKLLRKKEIITHTIQKRIWHNVAKQEEYFNVAKDSLQQVTLKYTTSPTQKNSTSAHTPSDSTGNKEIPQQTIPKPSALDLGEFDFEIVEFKVTNPDPNDLENYHLAVINNLPLNEFLHFDTRDFENIDYTKKTCERRVIQHPKSITNALQKNRLLILQNVQESISSIATKRDALLEKGYPESDPTLGTEISTIINQKQNFAFISNLPLKEFQSLDPKNFKTLTDINTLCRQLKTKVDAQVNTK